ncbi:hypothetical protein ETB97_007298 [Aspergillus alliaceus]|uniref:Uncharacterized protein n=1 Tax=Petromyces alliaceus TaxID=209559 RepID=A0A8H5ZWD0_PETAA|nr:hypothetical protein ETB97_007298 [Aspergillus burnettii]
MRSLLPLLRCSTLAVGQLISPVGPTTTLTQKTTECNILTYGAVADNSTDISTALETTFNYTGRPRLVRLISLTNASLHDLILIDSPKFYTILDFAVNVEAYHLTIRGANLGSYDGIDGIGTNYYIHDNEYARNISILNGNNIAFIITYPGGSGTVTNITFENFRSKPCLYGLKHQSVLAKHRIPRHRRRNPTQHPLPEHQRLCCRRREATTPVPGRERSDLLHERNGGGYLRVD